MKSHKHSQSKNECSMMKITRHTRNAAEKKKEGSVNLTLLEPIVQLNTGPTISQSELHTNRLQR